MPTGGKCSGKPVANVRASRWQMFGQERQRDPRRIEISNNHCSESVINTRFSSVEWVNPLNDMIGQANITHDNVALFEKANAIAEKMIGIGGIMI